MCIFYLRNILYQLKLPDIVWVITKCPGDKSGRGCGALISQQHIFSAGSWKLTMQNLVQICQRVWKFIGERTDRHFILYIQISTGKCVISIHRERKRKRERRNILCLSDIFLSQCMCTFLLLLVSQNKHKEIKKRKQVKKSRLAQKMTIISAR